MLGYVYCNGGKIAGLNTQFPAPEPEHEGGDHFPVQLRETKLSRQLQIAVCASLALKQIKKVQRKTTGGKSRSSHVRKTTVTETFHAPEGFSGSQAMIHT